MPQRAFAVMPNGSATRRRTAPPRALLVLLVVALVFGVAATFLAAPAAPPSNEGSNGAPGAVSGSTVGWASIGLFGLILGSLVARRIASGGGNWPLRTIAPLLAAFLVAIVFLIAIRAVVHVAPLPPDANRTAQNGSQSPPGPVSPGNLTLGPGPIAPGVPGWVLYVILGAVAVVALAVLYPVLMTPKGTPEEEGDRRAPVRRSLEAALKALDEGAGADARAIIIALYARLLERIAPELEHYDSATPREIEHESVRRFGISASHARALTVLFEEARYSSHEFTPPQVDRARAALEQALADLDAAGRIR